MKSNRIAPDIKEQIIKRIKLDGVTVSQAAADHGVKAKTIYGWLGASVQAGPSVLEYAKLKREHDELLKLVGAMTLKLSEAKKKK